MPRMLRHLTAALCAAAALLLAGCAGDGVRVVEGTDLSLGVSVPGSEGVLDLTFLNYLSGFRLQAEANSRVKLKYSCCETNDYLGIVQTRSAKTIEAETVPTVEEDDENKKEGESHD